MIMMKRMTWLVVMALVGVMSFAGAAFGATAGLEITVTPGASVGFDGGEHAGDYTIELSLAENAPGDGFVWNPATVEQTVSGPITISLPNLFWSVLLGGTQSHAQITVNFSGNNVPGILTDASSAISLHLVTTGFECRSEGEIGQACGDEEEDIDLAAMYNGATAILVNNIPNAYTGDQSAADEGLALDLVFEVDDWESLRGGTPLEAQLLIEIAPVG